jgi:hypothetical protein
MSDIAVRFKMMMENPPGLAWTPRLVQVYITFLSGKDNPDYIDEPVNRNDPEYKVSMEIQALCRSKLISGYNGMPIKIKDYADPELYLAGKTTFRIKVYPDFPKQYINNSTALKEELLKTCKTVMNRIHGEGVED